MALPSPPLPPAASPSAVSGSLAAGMAGAASEEAAAGAILRAFSLCSASSSEWREFEAYVHHTAKMYRRAHPIAH